MEDSAVRSRNITYDGFVLFSFKQRKRESCVSFDRRLIEQAENCSLDNEDPYP